MEYETVVTEMTVKPKGIAISDPGVTKISMDSEGDGLLLKISQDDADYTNVVRLDIEEWPAVREAIEKMYNEIIVQELTTP